MLPILQCIYTTSVISIWGTFSILLSLVILLLVLPSNFLVSVIKSFKTISCLYFKCNSLFYFIYLCSYWKIVCNCLIFFDDILKIVLNIWHNFEYDSSDNSNFSFHVRDDIINYFKFIIFVWLFYIFPYIVNAKIW